MLQFNLNDNKTINYKNTIVTVIVTITRITNKIQNKTNILFFIFIINLSYFIMIPVFEAKIDSYDTGIYKISLVDLPAVESDFVYFNKSNDNVKFSIDNEEQRMVTGVIMRANFPIYRYDEEFGEYYIKYSPETIKLMAEKMMIDNTFNNINLQHIDGTDVEGVNLVEIFIKDTSKGIDPIGFQDIEDGSLFATYKINIDSIWEQIKLGTFRGFSLEGIFDIERTQFRKTNKEKNTFLKTMNRLFNKFLKSFVKCGSLTTVDDRELYWVGEADLQIGDELFYNEDGQEAIKVEDGEYELKDGTKIVVEDGLVKDIREVDGEKEDSLDNKIEAEKKETKCEGEEIIVEDPVKPEDETKDEADKKYDELKNSYDELKADIDDLRKEHDELKGMFEEMKNTLDALLNKPAAEPIVEEFTNVACSKAENGIPTFGSRAKSFH